MGPTMQNWTSRRGREVQSACWWQRPQTPLNSSILELAASAAAKSQLAAMLTGGNLREIFGSEIAGIPTETVLAITQSQVWGGGAML